MNVVVYRRAKHGEGRAAGRARSRCSQPGASATDNSLIGVGQLDGRREQLRLLGPDGDHERRDDLARASSGSTSPTTAGLPARCGAATRRAPSVVPKLSLATGLVYTYTKPPTTTGPTPGTSRRSTSAPAQTIYKRLAGTGLGFNNNYAPVTLGPDGTAYVGALGGLVLLRDR